MEFSVIKVQKPEDVNVIIGQSHFIKTVEDIYEAVIQSVPDARFGVAFNEASGPCLIRFDGTDDELVTLAVDNANAIGAGHVFIVFLKGMFPVNCLNAIKQVPEVCTIFAATANTLQVVVAVTEQGRGIVGVIDGASPKGTEGDDDKKTRSEFLRKIGYKR